ncbi:MAG: alpha/beta hydrolase, partial [Pseudomonadota bacterium]
PAGAIPIRVYSPAGPGPHPGIVHFHGGGFVIGDLDSHDTIARRMALGADCMVVAVDYRLAPEHRYPAAVEDALDVWRWLVSNGGDINVDSQRIAVCGDSAGATLSAIITQTARDEGVPIRAQVLFYPLVDMAERHPSHDEHKATPPISADVLAYFFGHYLGPNADEFDLTDPRLSPLHAAHFADLPPAFVMTAGLDPLRDEGHAYAQRLSEAGCEVVYTCATGTIHGVLRMGRLIPVVHDVMDAGAAFLRNRIH